MNSELNQWGHYLLDFVTGQQQLSIQEQVRANGMVQWSVYDPHSHSRHMFTSELAVRAWLEQRHNR
jgi:hypothetical protein